MKSLNYVAIMAMQTIGALSKEIDLEVRKFLEIEELIITSRVCKDWKRLNEEISKIIFKKNVPFLSDSGNLSLNQICFFTKISSIGKFPLELIKLIGEFYQFKKLPRFGINVALWGIRQSPKFTNGFPKPYELTSPIMVANDERGFPYVLFKIREKISKTLEETGLEAVLVCTDSLEGWRFKYKCCPVTDHLNFTFEEEDLIPFYANIENITQIIKKKFKKVELAHSQF